MLQALAQIGRARTHGGKAVVVVERDHSLENALTRRVVAPTALRAAAHHAKRPAGRAPGRTAGPKAVPSSLRRPGSTSTGWPARRLRRLRRPTRSGVRRTPSCPAISWAQDTSLDPLDRCGQRIGRSNGCPGQSAGGRGALAIGRYDNARQRAGRKHGQTP